LGLFWQKEINYAYFGVASKNGFNLLADILPVKATRAFQKTKNRVQSGAA
jgi:hypothetical protein